MQHLGPEQQRGATIASTGAAAAAAGRTTDTYTRMHAISPIQTVSCNKPWIGDRRFTEHVY